MVKKRSTPRKQTSRRRTPTARPKPTAVAVGEEPERFCISDGREITAQIARELAAWRLRLIPAVVAARVWNTLFTDDDRARLGGNLSAAWEGEGRGTMAMYMRARHVSYERAMLEIAWGLGLMHPADYERLLTAIGGALAGRLRPIWDRERLVLKVGDQVVRRIRSRSVAPSACRVLDSFEELGWAARIDDPLPGSPDQQRLREVVRSLNRDLATIRFGADGTGKGIVWKFR